MLRISGWLTGAVLTLWISAAGATGYFLNGSGANNRALSGAGVALADDPMALAINPAAIVALPGRQWQIGSTFLRPRPKVEAGPLPDGALPDGSSPIPPGSYHSDPDVPLQIGGVFAIPSGAITKRLNQQWAIGFGVYGNGGLNSTFRDFNNSLCPPDSNGGGLLCDGTYSSDIAQTFLAPTVAWQATPWLSLGVSPLAVWEAIEVRGLRGLAPRSNDPANISNNGHDHELGYGVKAGITVKPLPSLSIAVVGESEIRIGQFEDYRGLLPDQGRLNIPPFFQVGFAWDITPQLAFVADLQKIYFSKVKATGNPGDASAPYGADNGPGFGWDDNKTYKFGIRYKLNPRWTLRGGYARATSPLKDNDVFFNFISGSILRDRFGLGASHTLASGTTFDFAVNYFAERTLKGRNPTLPEQDLKLSLSGVSLDFGIYKRFQ